MEPYVISYKLRHPVMKRCDETMSNKKQSTQNTSMDEHCFVCPPPPSGAVRGSPKRHLSNQKLSAAGEDEGVGRDYMF